MASHNWGQRPRSRIPQRVEDQVRRRDGVCQLQYDGCTQHIDEMDNVIGLAAQGIPRTPVRDATTSRGVCRHCHSIKSEQQRQCPSGTAIVNHTQADSHNRRSQPQYSCRSGRSHILYAPDQGVWGNPPGYATARYCIAVLTMPARCPEVEIARCVVGAEGLEVGNGG